jgi:hypothetical protein
MCNRTLAPLLVCLALAGSIAAVPAHAQASRTFVAAQGADTNACTFASPCRSFQRALTQTQAGGEIDALDPAGYGAVTIDRAISIQGHGFAAVTAAAGDAVTVTAGGNDNVGLYGLILDGGGTGGNGVQFNSGRSLDLRASVIRGFSTGVHFTPSTSSQLYVSTTHIAENTQHGVEINPSGTASARGVLSRVESTQNGADGIRLIGTATSGSLNFSISDSLVANNGGNGVFVDGGSGADAALVRNASIAGNRTGTGVLVQGATALLRVTSSTITGNLVGFATQAGGAISSHGFNNLNGNDTDGAPTQTPGPN